DQRRDGEAARHLFEFLVAQLAVGEALARERREVTFGDLQTQRLRVRDVFRGVLDTDGVHRLANDRVLGCEAAVGLQIFHAHLRTSEVVAQATPTCRALPSVAIGATIPTSSSRPRSKRPARAAFTIAQFRPCWFVRA